MIWQGQVTGVIHVLRDIEDRPFTHDEMELLTLFANQSAIAVENVRLFTAEEQRARQLDSLHTATTTLLSTLELDALLNQILQAAKCAIPKAEKGSLSLVNSRSRDLVIHAITGYTDPRLSSIVLPPEGYAVRAVREKRALLIPDLHKDPELRYTGDIAEVHSIRSAVVAPLLWGEEVLGAISLDSDQVNDLTEDDKNLLVSFAATATAAIRNAQLHAKVQWMAITDPLTGLYNRRGLFTFGEREVERYHRFGHPLASIMLDIDNFKVINDTYTHASGDQVLRELANTCRHNLRDLDIIGRYGGEEFVILLPEADIPKANQIAERLRHQVEITPVPLPQNLINVTISLGVAPASKETPNLITLIERADRAMYIAKQTGRNRVSF
jgi:diguanylate cyclase (GGDEF)-like protein